MSKPPVHPGQHLKTEYIDRLGLTDEMLANRLFVHIWAVTGLVQGDIRMHGDMALRLERYFGVLASYWMKMQLEYDMATDSRKPAAGISMIRPHPRKNGEWVKL